MGKIEQKRAQRYLYLKRLYELAGGTTSTSFAFEAIGQELGWDDTTRDQVETYLQNEGLIEVPAFDQVGITPKGVQQIERAIAEPDHATQYFPPLSHIVVLASGDVTIHGDVIGRTKSIKSG